MIATTRKFVGETPEKFTEMVDAGVKFTLVLGISYTLHISPKSA